MKAFRDIRVIPVVLIAILGLAVLKVAGLVIDGGYVFDHQSKPAKKSWAQDTFNFPSVRLASQGLVILNKADVSADRFNAGSLAEWDHSAWDRREVIHAGPDKVHIDTRFTRYRRDGSVIGGFDSIYVVTRQDGHWGIKIRSSFAP